MNPQPRTLRSLGHGREVDMRSDILHPRQIERVRIGVVAVVALQGPAAAPGAVIITTFVAIVDEQGRTPVDQPAKLPDPWQQPEIDFRDITGRQFQTKQADGILQRPAGRFPVES